MSDEPTLLREYASSRSEAAFDAIVHLHATFVFATALRQVGDRGIAEEITQNVFVALARKPPTLRGDSTIAGWLYRTTLNQARMRLRTELRRHRREQKAAELAELIQQGEASWSTAIPLLDEALCSLVEKDRLAVILRFMEDRPLREVGAILGIGEDAARKRIDRILDELTTWFRKHGFVLPAGAVAAGLSAQSTVATPALATSAIFSAAAAGTSTISTLSILGILMASTKLKITVATFVAICIGVSLSLNKSSKDEREKPQARIQSQPPAISNQLPSIVIGSPKPNAASTTPGVFQRIINGDMSLTMLQRDLVDAYLARSKTNAESLLIAYRVTHDPEYLRASLEKFPTNSSVLFRAVIHDAMPGQRRDLLEQYKQADPNNALPHYLSAADHLKNGNRDAAFADLSKALQSASFRDDITEQVLNLEEIYLSAGFSPGEAKALGMSAVEMPHVSELARLGGVMNKLANEYLQNGDKDSSDRIASVGIDLANRLRSVQDGGNLLGEMVGLAVERDFLKQLDTTRTYSFLNTTVQQRLDQLAEQEMSIRADSQFMDKWLINASEADVITYFDRLKLYGESAALQWLRKRSTGTE